MNKNYLRFRIGFTLILSLTLGIALAQETSLVQVNVFDLNLKAIANLRISFDGENYLITGRNGSIYTEIDNTYLPPKVIYFADENLEAESWNYSKGILEIIVREKLFENYHFVFMDSSDNRLKDLPIIIKTAKPIAAVTNSSGRLDLAVPVATDFSDNGIIEIEDYRVLDIQTNNNTITVQAALIPPEPTEEPLLTVEEPGQLDELRLSRLDSIANLPQFWAYTRMLNMISLTVDDKLLLDKKFNELWTSYSDSLRTSSFSTSNISDSSLLTDDIFYLSERAKLEGQQLNQTRMEFNDKISVISEKIVEGGRDISDSERQRLLTEINQLDELLSANEAKFKENQTFYQSTIDDLKNRIVDVQVLEDKLTEIEKQSIIDREIFQRRLIMFITIGSGLVILLLLFMHLLRKISKQKKALVKANKEVKDINNRLEILVAKRTATLQKVNKELDTFLYRSSHDLKRPISSIIGLANIAKITLNAEANDLFEKARITADDMNKLIQKLIAISQINSANDYAEINFRDFMMEINESYLDTIEQNGAEVIYNIEDELQFTANPHLLDIIMRSLLENALFYSSFKRDIKPIVEISAKLIDGTMQIEVKDNGEGISNEISNKIWNMFYRGHVMSTGNGLGLYMTRRAIEVLKGTISFESTEGEFTKFNVEIPTELSITALEKKNNEDILVESV